MPHPAHEGLSPHYNLTRCQSVPSHVDLILLYQASQFCPHLERCTDNHGMIILYQLPPALLSSYARTDSEINKKSSGSGSIKNVKM